MKFLLAAVLFFTAPAFGQKASIPKIPKHITFKNAIYINGVIDYTTTRVADQILSQASRPGAINIVIDSPGGSIFAGNTVVQAINMAQSSGKVVNCVVTRFAASMAFIIFNECTNRYALQTSLLLWHSPRISYMGILTPDVIRPLYDQLTSLKKFFDQRVLSKLKISKSKYEYYSKNDFVHFGQDLYQLDPTYLKLVSGVSVAVPQKSKKK